MESNFHQFPFPANMCEARSSYPPRLKIAGAYGNSLVFTVVDIKMVKAGGFSLMCLLISMGPTEQLQLVLFPSGNVYMLVKNRINGWRKGGMVYACVRELLYNLSRNKHLFNFDTTYITQHHTYPWQYSCNNI